MKDWQGDFDDFDRKFDRAQKFVGVWVVFVALLALATMGGIGYTVYRILLHFGIF